MYLCKKKINPEEPCPSGLNSNERLCISLIIPITEGIQQIYMLNITNKNYFFTAVGRLNSEFLAFLGISMAVVVPTEFTSIS